MKNTPLAITGVLFLFSCAAMNEALKEDPPGPPAPPSDHVLVNDESLMVAVDGMKDYPFEVASPFTVKFQVTNRSTTDPDKWDVGVLSAHEYQFFKNGRQSKKAIWQPQVSDTTGEAELPAGLYHFVIRCANELQRCELSYSLALHY